MVSKEVIETVFDKILYSDSDNLIGKCRPKIDEVAFSKLSTPQQIADFFGLKLLDVGRPECAEANKDLSNFGFYDEKNDVKINFFDKEPYKMKYIDFENHHSRDYEGDDDDGYTCNLRDVIRAYYDAPVSLKRATEMIDIINETPSFDAGNCDMHDITLHKDTFLYGYERIQEVMYHEMTHAFENNFLHGDYKSEQYGVLASDIKDRWEKATNDDYAYQKSKGYTKQDTTEYAEENPREDFAEMGSVVSSQITRSNYRMSNAYRYTTTEDGTRKHHIQATEDIIEANPNRYKLMKELISGNKGSVKDKQAYRRNWDKAVEELGL